MKTIIIYLTALFWTTGFGQVTGTVLSDFPTGGPLGLPINTVDIFTMMNIPQITAGQTITIPLPTNVLANKNITINNIGTTPFTLSPGGVVPPKTGVIFRWLGATAQWSVTGGAQASLSYPPNTFLASPDASAGLVSGRLITMPDMPSTGAPSGTWNNLTLNAAGYPVSGSNVAYLTSVPAQTFASLTGKPTTLSGYGISDAYPLSGNPSGFITSIPAEVDPNVPTYSKTLSAFSVIKASTDPLYRPISYTPSSAEISSALGYTPLSVESDPTFNTKFALKSTSDLVEGTNKYDKTVVLTNGTAISTSGTYPNFTINNTAPDQTVSLTAGAGIVVTGTYPNFTISMKPVTINNAPSRTVNNNFTISSTSDAWVSYSITCSVTNPLVAGSSSANAYLEYSLNSGSTWATPTQAGNLSSVGVAVAIQITNGQTVPITGWIPANALVRIRTTTSGTASVSLPYQTEVTR